MRNLAPDVVGAVDREAAGREGEGGAVRALDGGHPTVPIAGAATVVAQAYSVLNSFLYRDRQVHGCLTDYN